MSDTYVRRHYGRRNGKNAFTWRVVADGEVIAKSARSYATAKALDAAIARVRRLLGFVTERVA